MRYIKQFLHDNLNVIGISSKSGHIFLKPTVRKYLKSKRFFRLKAQKKHYLFSKQKKNKLKQEKKHLCQTIKDWSQVIQMDEAIFEISLDSRSYYVTKKLVLQQSPTILSSYLRVIGYL